VSPRVSIGMPVYNGERYLAEALDSILAQDFGDFELIISDNASTDATRDICKTYARRDPRIAYSRLPENLGAAPNYNRVFHMSTGDFFKWAAHDDRLHPAFLSRCLDAFQEFKTLPVLIYPKAEFIDQNGVRIGPDNSRMYANSNHSSVRAFQAIQGMGAVASAVFGVFHRNTLERTRLIGNFFPSDRVLLLETALLGRIIQLEGEPLFQRRIHPEISTKANLSDRDRSHWYDPQARSKLSPSMRVLVEYLRSAGAMSDLDWLAKVFCVPSIVAGVALRSARVPLGRYRRRVVSRISSKRL
jgi:glycosyltransferase involved in cell wall biosynthesis